MSSSSRPRARVIRGGAAVARNVQPVPFAVDLTVPALTKVDRAAVEEAVTAGHRDGFESGRHEGYQAGMAAARAEVAAADEARAIVVEQAVQALQHAITQLRRAQVTTLAGMEDDLAAGAFAVAEAVLDRELTVVADPSVEPAGAVVVVGACRIDAQIGSALERVREALA